MKRRIDAATRRIQSFGFTVAYADPMREPPPGVREANAMLDPKRKRVTVWSEAHETDAGLAETLEHMGWQVHRIVSLGRP